MMIMSKIKIVGIGYDGADYLEECGPDGGGITPIVANIAKEVGEISVAENVNKILICHHQRRINDIFN